MKRNSCLLFLSILTFLIIPAANTFALHPDNIEVLLDDDYFEKLHQELTKAKESIYVEMYLAKVDSQEADAPVYRLIQDLINAHQRGVKVDIVLEDAFKSKMNQKAYGLLLGEGVNVKYDGPDKITHSKLIIIDKCKVIVGSQNWSYYALRLNHEAGVLINSGQLASVILEGSFESKDKDIVVLDEEKYFAGVIRAIKGADKSIDILMYQYDLNPKRKFTTLYQIAKELIAAEDRGVKVRLILDQNFRKSENKYGYSITEVEKKNLNAWQFLTDKGIDVQFDTASRVTHSKLIVLDAETVILGSQNWTEQSVDSDQISILVRCEPLAQKFIQAIFKVETASSQALPGVYDESYSIYLPDEFFFKLADEPDKYVKTVGSKLFTNQAHKAFNLYLLLLWEWDGNPQAKIKLDYETLTKELGYEKIVTEADELNGYPFAYFRLVKRLCRDLDKKYGLVKYNEEEGYVELLDYIDRGKSFSVPKRQYISIPFVFWEYGWAKELSMKAKYIYFISLLERQKSTIKPWWFDSQENLSKRYKISVGSIEGGLLELQRHNLLEIYRFSPEPGEPYAHRWSNNYYINELLPPEEIKSGWRQLQDKYGRRNVNRAKELAAQLNEPQDQEIIARFIQLIERYGWKKVKQANALTAKLRVENPKRHIGYTIQILKAEKE